MLDLLEPYANIIINGCGLLLCGVVFLWLLAQWNVHAS